MTNILEHSRFFKDYVHAANSFAITLDTPEQKNAFMEFSRSLCVLLSMATAEYRLKSYPDLRAHYKREDPEALKEYEELEKERNRKNGGDVMGNE